MTMTWKDCPVRANAFCLSSDRRASSAAMFPADKPCFDIFSPPPGESDVINQVERLSSNETKIAPTAAPPAGKSDLRSGRQSRRGDRDRHLAAQDQTYSVQHRWRDGRVL